MRVLFLSHLFPDSYEPASGIFNVERAKALQKAGCQVEFIAPKSIIPPLKYLFPFPQFRKVYNYLKCILSLKRKQIYDGVPVNYLRWLPFPKYLSWKRQVDFLHLSCGARIKSIWKQLIPDLIICSVAYPEGIYAKFFRKYCRVPIYVISEGSELLVSRKKRGGINKILKWLNKYSDVQILVSDYMFQKLNEISPFANPSIIPNGFNSNLFHFKGRLRTEDAPFRIVSVGNLDFVKGHDLLIRAVAGIPDIQLIIIGSGENEDLYKRMINEEGLVSRIFMKGFMTQSDIRSEFESCDLFCLPSRSESFGIAAIEAMACGLPVVAFRVGEMPAIIEEGINGYLAEDCTAESLKNCILSAILKEWNAYTISNIVVGKYSWSIWAQNIIELTETSPSREK